MATLTASLLLQTEDMDPEFAKRVKARIEKTTLGDVAEYIEEVYSRNNHFLIIKLDINKIKTLKLEVDVNCISYA